MYGRASLFHWVYVLERVRTRASFWDSILVYILGESMSRPFDFCERGERPFFRIFGFLPYSSLYPFLCDLSPCFHVGWPSLTFIFSSIFILLLHFTLPHLISFFSHPAWCSTWVQHPHLFLLIRYVHSFIITFRVGILRSTTHDIF